MTWHAKHDYSVPAADPRVWMRFVRTDGCWQWQGIISDRGYGRIKHRTLFYVAHRVVYTALVGPVPLDLTLDHTCGNRACVRPDHLEPVTVGENVRRWRRARGALMSRA